MAKRDISVVYGVIPAVTTPCGNVRSVQKRGKFVSPTDQWFALHSTFSDATFYANPVIWEPCSTNNHEPLMGSGAKGNPQAGVPRALFCIYIYLLCICIYI